MASIQIRNVPTDVHSALTRHAEAAGMSLSGYLRVELDRIARRNRNNETLQRAHDRPGKRPSSAEIVRVIREMRGD